nr:UvrD-helicase domain-containing protein [Pullulanibacillus pueri]
MVQFSNAKCLLILPLFQSSGNIINSSFVKFGRWITVEDQNHKQEQAHLTRTLNIISQQKERLEEVDQYVGDDITEQALEDIRERTRQSLKIAEKEPYFARLDFQEDLTPQAEALYIGKVGVADESGEPLIIDWRAPIASLFYSFAGGNDLAYYESPEGLVEGYIHLKRNIVIRNRQLQRIVDAYVKGKTDLSNVDEFLLYRLSERESSKLQDIVSTIQTEQNNIIRAPKNSALIIQGVAGSGKTTIALHRLAYLIYQHQDKLRSERMIIFAPNRLFLDYIADVLPELGVGGIQQTTFNDWALEQLDEPLTLRSQHESHKEWLETGGSPTAMERLRYKGSPAFITYVHQALAHYEAEAIPDQYLELLPHKGLSSETIKQWFYTDYKHYPLSKRKERIETKMKNWVEEALKSLESGKEKQALKRKAHQKIRAYLKKHLSPTAVSFYMQLLKADQTCPPDVKAQTLEMLKSKEIYSEDLPPLTHIHHYLNGVPKEQKFHHVVIDEAQDFSPYQVDILKTITLNHSFTILGDLSQGIHEYKGIDDWSAFSERFDQSKVTTFVLEKSYRSTTEIIDCANKVLTQAYQPMCLAEPVFRSGEEVKVIACNDDNYHQSLIESIQKALEKGYTNIGILTRTEAESTTLEPIIQSAGLKCTLLSGQEDKYSGGLSLSPVYLSKGLEFEATIIANVSRDHYPSNAFHAKLLYVGCTRALHELTLMYKDVPSLLIEPII